jgi:hypothetical protein
MVGKQGVAAPVSCRFWISGTAVLYMSACASLCKRQPTIILRVLADTFDDYDLQVNAPNKCTAVVFSNKQT